MTMHEEDRAAYVRCSSCGLLDRGDELLGRRCYRCYGGRFVHVDEAWLSKRGRRTANLNAVARYGRARKD